MQTPMTNDPTYFSNFIKYICGKDEVKLKNKQFDILFKTYILYYISDENILETNKKYEIEQNIKKSESIFIDKLEIDINEIKYIYLIVGFEQTILIFNQSSLSFLKKILSKYPELIIYDLSNSKNILDTIQIPNKGIELDPTFNNYINEICQICKLQITNTKFNEYWLHINRCFVGTLIRKSYSKLTKDRYQTFDQNFCSQEINEDDFVMLHVITTSSTNKIILIYHIKLNELLIIKRSIDSNDKLIKREISNYSELKHVLIPKFYGIVKNENYLVIEYIKGRTLDKIINELAVSQKIVIILELMQIIAYLHSKNFIYRDLKPDNVMIDDHKRTILIDFDKMIKYVHGSNEEHTKDIQELYSAPEIQWGIASKKSDIFSLGKMMKFLIKENDSNDQLFKIQYRIINEISEMCIKIDPESRPSISEVIAKYNQVLIFNLFVRDLPSSNNNVKNPNEEYLLGNTYQFIYKDINNAIYHYTLAAEKNHPQAQLNLGSILINGDFVTRDINKGIHYIRLAADQNLPEAQFSLGVLYLENKYVSIDINKAIHYLTLAADQNFDMAQFELGKLYYIGTHVTQDIQKALYYLELAAKNNNINAQKALGLYYSEEKGTKDFQEAIFYLSFAAEQNDADAQYKIAKIYYEGKLAPQQIDKALYFYTRASNQNHAEAQYQLGMIYYEGKYVEQNINRAIHFFTLASEQNSVDAQYILGCIYYTGQYVTKNIQKAKYYFKLAAEHNHEYAHYNLAVIYYFGKSVQQDIKKVIHHYKFAADRNIVEAQFSLAVIYKEGKYVSRDINKAIHFYSLAAKQNYVHALYALGLIYYFGEYVVRDINKAIHYYSMAANQNLSSALYDLGCIYYNNKYVPRDINKAIHYYTLAANQDHPASLYNLGLIYLNGEFIAQNINKAIDYLSRSANLFYAKAQFVLGVIYEAGYVVPKDMNKAINYFQMASNQNDSQAQYWLGIIYFKGISVKPYIKKGIFLIQLSSKNGFKQASFSLGYLYHEGKYIEKDIQQAIHYYKIASTFNNHYAKNNLGIIYAKGFQDDIQANAANGLVFFEEAIRMEQSILAMYNLANIYLFDETIKHDTDKSIDLLIKSFNYFSYSNALLCLLLIHMHGFDFVNINKEIEKFTNKSDDIYLSIQTLISLYDKQTLEVMFESYRDKLFVYNIFLEAVLVSDFDKIEIKESKTKVITSIFYEGFGRELL